MTAFDALKHIDALDVDVYACPGGELLLRSRNAGVAVPKLAIAFAQTYRENIAAFGAEFTEPQSKGERNG